MFSSILNKWTINYSTSSIAFIQINLYNSHAEILAIRVLRKYLYKQLLARVRQEASDESVFEEAESDREDASGGARFRLKPNVHFHLFVSSAPCGDARIFAIADTPNVTATSEGARKAHGLLRTKIESGEGTIPLVLAAATETTAAHSNAPSARIQTWDGILVGDRLRIMSCSDKVFIHVYCV